MSPADSVSDRSAQSLPHSGLLGWYLVPLVLGLICLAFALWGVLLERESGGLPALARKDHLTQATLAPQAQRSQRREPLEIVPNVPETTLSRDWSSLDVLSKRLWPDRRAEFGAVIHALHTYESDCQPPSNEQPSLDELKSVVMDFTKNGEWFNGQCSIVETGEGLRFISGRNIPSASAHVDQTLWILGHMGVSLDDPLITPLGRSTLQDVLDDSIANFHLEGELEWTSAALILYLPPQRSWQNKIGMEFNFDILAKELMSRSFSKTPCSGTHDLYALALLLRADRMEPVLSDGVRDMMEDFLRRTTAVLHQSQLANGAFPSDWYRQILREPWYWDIVAECEKSYPDQLRQVREMHLNQTQSPEGQDIVSEEDAIAQPTTVTRSSMVHMTGHHLEWLLMLPPEFQPEAALFERATEFCAEALEVADADELRIHVCPYSHAARMLRLFLKRSSDRTKRGVTAEAVTESLGQPTGTRPDCRLHATLRFLGLQAVDGEPASASVGPCCSVFVSGSSCTWCDGCGVM